MDLQLKDNNVLVTGGSKGIGLAIAELFAAEGANVAICARNADQVDGVFRPYGEAHGVEALVGPQEVFVEGGHVLFKLGAALGARDRRHVTSRGVHEGKRDLANPVPIPIGSFGFHVNAPAFLDPIDADPSTITDFQGFTGLAYISGMVSRTDRRTNAKVDLPFLSSDMRFMEGEYQGFDGRVRRGTFGFI